MNSNKTSYGAADTYVALNTYLTNREISETEKSVKNNVQHKEKIDQNVDLSTRIEGIRSPILSSGESSLNRLEVKSNIPKKRRWTLNYTLSFNGNDENYSDFKKQWGRNFRHQKLKIRFDDKAKKVFTGYSKRELLALVQNKSHLEPFFGYSNDWEKYNIFNGYDSPRGLYLDRSRKNLATDTDELIKKANEFFAKFSSKDIRLDIQLEDLKSDETLIKKVFKQREGLIIGEVHFSNVAKNFIVNNLNLFKEMGVMTIFMEHLFFDTMQDELDAYFESERDELPTALNAYLAFLDRGFSVPSCTGREDPGFSHLVRSVKRAGIRLVAIDTEASYEAGMDYHYGARGRNRMLGMNYTAYKIIQKEKGVGKYLALVGSAHTSRHAGVIGLRQLTGCPSLVISKRFPGSQETVLSVRNYGEGKDVIDFIDIFLSRD